MHHRIALLLAVVLIAAACGDDAAAPTTSAAATTQAPAATTEAPATTAVPATTTTQAPESTEATAVYEVNAAGEVFIDWSALDGIFFAAPVPTSTDPFFHVHNDPATDGFFLSIEAYTTGYGTAWTGETGMFQIDCSPSGSGICVHFDPDGPGPEGDLGADFLVTGDIEIVQADSDGFEAILSNVAFTDGTTIPGPLTITG